jgi:hypothetical protein
MGFYKYEHQTVKKQATFHIYSKHSLASHLIADAVIIKQTNASEPRKPVEDK